MSCRWQFVADSLHLTPMVEPSPAEAQLLESNTHEAGVGKSLLNRFNSRVKGRLRRAAQSADESLCSHVGTSRLRDG
jgi:hypothetical protein